MHLHPEQALLEYFSWGSSYLVTLERVLGDIKRDYERRDEHMYRRAVRALERLFQLETECTERDRVFREAVSRWQESDVARRDAYLAAIEEHAKALDEVQKRIQSLCRRVMRDVAELPPTRERDEHHLLMFEHLS